MNGIAYYKYIPFFIWELYFTKKKWAFTVMEKQDLPLFPSIRDNFKNLNQMITMMISRYISLVGWVLIAIVIKMVVVVIVGIVV